MNSIIKYSAIVGILLLGACGSSDNENNVLNGGAGFSARTFTVPENLSNRIMNSDFPNGVVINAIAYDYLDSISFEIHNETNFFADVIYINRPRKEDAFIFIELKDEINRLHLTPPMTPALGVHIFVGILDTTDVGVPLSASATFRGDYRHSLTVAPGSRRKESDSYSARNKITLEVDFDAKTLKGVSDRRSYDIHQIEVNGQFSADSTTLSGSVSLKYPEIDRTFTAPLTGLIGIEGAVGVFSAYENTGVGAGYTFGGGFAVGRVAQ